MITKSFITTSAFYARSICTLVKKAGELSSNTTLEFEGNKGTSNRTYVILKVDGTDKENAIDANENVIKKPSRF